MSQAKQLDLVLPLYDTNTNGEKEIMRLEEVTLLLLGTIMCTVLALNSMFGGHEFDVTSLSPTT